MVEKNQKKEQEYGEVLLEWKFPEYEEHKRTRSWYIGMIIVFIFFFLYSVFTNNFLFTIFIVLFAVMSFLHFKNPALEIDVKICEDGILIGKRFYEWLEIKNFRLVYRPPEVKKLYFDPKSSFIPEIAVFLKNKDPLEVRKILKDYLEEDLTRQEENIFDRLNRWLKI